MARRILATVLEGRVSDGQLWAHQTWIVRKQSIDAMFPHFRNGAVRKGLSCHGVEIPSAFGDVMHAIVVAVPGRRLLRMRQLLGASSHLGDYICGNKHSANLHRAGRFISLDHSHSKKYFYSPMSNVAPEALGLVQIRASLWGVRPPPPTNRADHKSMEWYSITNGTPSSRKRAILGDGRNGISRFHLLNRDATDHFLEYVLRWYYEFFSSFVVWLKLSNRAIERRNKAKKTNK